jgi:multimeric flavodoxin WrbA
MKFYAINGSPRKNKNTATLLQSALDGIRSAATTDNIETEMIHLYDLDYQPCISCFACKRLGGKSYGKCVVKDSLKPIMEKLADADGIIFGSPIYFASISAKLRGFLERFLFQYFVYDDEYSSLAPKKMPTAFIYTMNVTEEAMLELDYRANLKYMEYFVQKMFTEPQVLHAFNTYQFDDYSKYKVECFSETDKAEYRDHQFPVDREKAFELGVSMLSSSSAK